MTSALMRDALHCFRRVSVETVVWLGGFQGDQGLDAVTDRMGALCIPEGVEVTPELVRRMPGERSVSVYQIPIRRIVHQLFHDDRNLLPGEAVFIINLGSVIAYGTVGSVTGQQWTTVGVEGVSRVRRWLHSGPWSGWPVVVAGPELTGELHGAEQPKVMPVEALVRAARLAFESCSTAERSPWLVGSLHNGRFHEAAENLAGGRKARCLVMIVGLVGGAFVLIVWWCFGAWEREDPANAIDLGSEGWDHPVVAIHEEALQRHRANLEPLRMAAEIKRRMPPPLAGRLVEFAYSFPDQYTLKFRTETDAPAELIEEIWREAQATVNRIQAGFPAESLSPARQQGALSTISIRFSRRLSGVAHSRTYPSAVDQERMPNRDEHASRKNDHHGLPVDVVPRGNSVELDLPGWDHDLTGTLLRFVTKTQTTLRSAGHSMEGCPLLGWEESLVNAVGMPAGWGVAEIDARNQLTTLQGLINLIAEQPVPIRIAVDWQGLFGRERARRGKNQIRLRSSPAALDAIIPRLPQSLWPYVIDRLRLQWEGRDLRFDLWLTGPPEFAGVPEIPDPLGHELPFVPVYFYPMDFREHDPDSGDESIPDAPVNADRFAGAEVVAYIAEAIRLEWRGSWSREGDRGVMLHNVTAGTWMPLALKDEIDVQVCGTTINVRWDRLGDVLEINHRSGLVFRLEQGGSITVPPHVRTRWENGLEQLWILGESVEWMDDGWQLRAICKDRAFAEFARADESEGFIFRRLNLP